MLAHTQRAAYALQKLAEQDPALGALALWCQHRDAEAGAADGRWAWTDGQTIHYAPAFLDLAPHEQVGLTAHHVLHIAFRHGPRSRAMLLRFGERYAADIYNAGADALVNETLLLAGYALPRPCVTLGPLLVAAGQASGGDAPLGQLDVDALYVMLLHERHPGTGGKAVREDESAARAEQVRDAARRLGFTPDLDPSEDTDEGGQADADEADWQQRVARAMEEGRRAGRGIGALGFRLGDLPEVRTPWETVLRGLVTKAVLQERQPNYRRPSRRWLALDALAREDGTPPPVFQPSFRQEGGRPRIVIGLDSSGSIDATRLGHFAAQVAAIARKTRAEVHLLVFDEDVRSHRRLDGPNLADEIARIEFSRDGGTSFVDVIERSAGLDPSIIVILTDLDGPFGQAPRGCPVLWAVPARTERTPPFGRVLSLAS